MTSLNPKTLAAQLAAVRRGNGLIGHDGHPVGQGILLVLARMHEAVDAGDMDACAHINRNSTSLDDAAHWRPDLPQAVLCATCHDRLAAVARPETRCTGCRHSVSGKTKAMHIVPACDNWPPVLIVALLCPTCLRPPNREKPRRQGKGRRNRQSVRDRHRRRW